MAETLTIRTASSTEVVKIAVPGPQGPKGDKGDPGDVAGLPLSTLGDTLYRGASENQRLPIGTTGQVLKVSAQGLPAWANESGAVSSVNGQTGAVILDGSDIESSGNDVDAAFIAATFDEGDGIYFPLPDSFINSKPVYRTTSGHSAFFENSRWHITDGSPVTTNIIESSDNDNAAWPWLSAWSGDVTKAKLSDVVGRARDTFLFVGDSIPNTSVSGLASVAATGDYDDLSGKPAIPSASSATPSALGVAAAGTSSDYARADHVHAMPSAADVGAAPSTGIEQTDVNSYLGNNTLADDISYLDGVASSLGTAATADSTDFAAASHAASHASSGSDPLFDQDLNTTDSPTFASVTLTNTGTDGDNLLGCDDQGNIYRVTDGNFDLSAAYANLGLGDSATANIGTAAGEVCAGDDARLSDSRTPTAHAASHASAGSDPLFDQDLNTTDAPTFTSVSAVGNVGTLQMDDYGLVWEGARRWDVETSTFQDGSEAPVLALPSSDPDSNPIQSYAAISFSGANAATNAATTLTNLGAASDDHVHGNLTNDGKIGSTAGLPVVTTTAGAVTTLALGTANQVLRVNSGASGVEFADPAASGVTGAAASASDVLGVSGANITGVDANADRIVFWDDSASALKYLEAGSGLSISGTTLSTTGGGVTTGSVDNAILRADGTGGSTSQGSAFVIPDNATASPNNTVNHASIQATGDTTNVSVSIVPKGTGAFMLRVPDSASTGGNARGVNAVDLMLERLAANQVASGEASFAAGARHIVSGTRAAAVGGYGSTASGNNAVTLGALNTATGETSGSLCGYYNDATASEAVVVGGNSNDATAARSSVIGGNNNTASADSSICVGGQRATANRFCIHAHAAGQFAAGGDAQRIRAVLRCKTTTNAAVEMALDGSTTYLTIPSGKVIFCNIKVVGVKSDGSAVATYERQYAAKNVAGTSSEVYAAVTIGMDNAASTSLEVATVDAGDYIRIRPTGIASETWRWVASVDAVEVAYGT